MLCHQLFYFAFLFGFHRGRTKYHASIIWFPNIKLLSFFSSVFMLILFVFSIFVLYFFYSEYYIILTYDMVKLFWACCHIYYYYLKNYYNFSSWRFMTMSKLSIRGSFRFYLKMHKYFLLNYKTILNLPFCSIPQVPVQTSWWTHSLFSCAISRIYICCTLR